MLKGGTPLSKHIRVTPDRSISCIKLCPGGAQLQGYQQARFIEALNKSLCTMCGMGFCRISELRLHEFHKHNIAPPELHVCDVCGFSSATAIAVRKHKRRIHGRKDGPKSFVCDVCGQGFAAVHKLWNHRNAVHKPKTHKCSFCRACFRERRFLEQHEILHAGIKPYPCRYCGKGFGSSKNQRVHERIHTGYKPHKCELCSEAFAQKNSLDVHKKSRHGIDRPPSDPKFMKQKRGRVAFVPELARQKEAMLEDAPAVDLKPLEAGFKQPHVNLKVFRPFSDQ
jgi:uncharacterized Zn-finger protein